MSVIFRYYYKFIRIMCISAGVFATFITPALSSNNLPSGYTELEYIQSTQGTAIDLPVINGDFEVNIKIQQTQLYDLEQHIIQFDNGFQALYWSKTYRGYRVWKSSVAEQLGYDDTNVHNIHITITNSAYIADIDGTQIVNTNKFTTADTNGHKFRLFSYYSSSSLYNFLGKIYSFSYKLGNDIQFNGVPAKRNSDGAIGMYDLVSKTFFTNAGTGSFIAGPVVENIHVATTKYVEEQFAPISTELNTTIGTIETVVENTITQADRISALHTGKQNRPDDYNTNEQCPAGRNCLLIAEPDGSLHWYPICDADGSVEPLDVNGFLEALTVAGNPNVKGTQSGSNWTYYNGFFKGMSAWRKQYADGSTSTYDRPFASATRCTNPNYNTGVLNASPCYTETGMYKTLTDGEWAVVYEGDEKASNASSTANPGVIYGISKCVSTNLTGTVASAGKATTTQLADPLFSGIPNDKTDGADYKQCWCKMTDIGIPGGGATTAEKASKGKIVGVSGSAWVFHVASSSATDCAYRCAYNCASTVQDSSAFRAAIIDTNN